jgi:hypothetical protein
LLPKRPFAHIPVKITLLLAGGAIAIASFAGAPASGAARPPAEPAQAAQPASLDRAIPSQAIALVADAAPYRHGNHRHHGHRGHHRYRGRHGRRPHRRHGHRHRKYRWLRHRPHHGRRHHHARRHWIHRLPQRIAWSLLTAFHWAHWQFRYLDLLWIRESGWNPFASNPYSGAYGIPQALPASKMATAGPNWRTDARTQILWGMGYIRDRYVTPYRAWLHEMRCGWY